MTGCRLRIVPWFVVLCSVAGAEAPSDAMFEPTALRTIRLTMADPADWQRLVDNPQENTVYPCAFDWNGENLARVGVRAKGQSSRESGTKPSIRFRFNHYLGQKFLGLTRLDCNSLKSDPSMIRERLILSACRRRGLVAPRAMHVRLEVDGAYVGLYLIIDQWDQEEALRIHLGDHRGNLYKLVGGDDGTLWRGEDPSAYFPDMFSWERQRTDRPDDFLQALDAINNTSDAEFAVRLSQVLDVDELLDYCAINEIVSNEDWLFIDAADWGPPIVRGAPRTKNWYWYALPSTGRFETLIWDVSDSMMDYWTGEGWVRRDIFLGFDQHVLGRRMMAVEAWRSQYVTRVREWIDGAFAPAVVVGELDQVYAQVRGAAMVDPWVADSFETFESEVAGLRRDIPARAEKVRQQLAR